MTERSNILPFKRIETDPDKVAFLIMELSDIQERAKQIRVLLGYKAITTFEEIE